MHINIAFVQENIEVTATTGSKNDDDVMVMVVLVMMMMITYRAQTCQHCNNILIAGAEWEAACVAQWGGGEDDTKQTSVATDH